MTRKYFGTDGIRGRVGEGPISADFMLRLGNAYGHALVAASGAGREWRNPMVVIGKDTRISNYMFEAALEAGLVAAGVDVQLMGPLPTPAVAHPTPSMRADRGIVISASHNPYYDNGIKFFSAQGTKLTDEWEEMVESALQEEPVWAESEQLGKARRLADAAGRYIEFCKSTFGSELTLRGRKIVVDAAHGAAYHIAPKVFHELGAEVISIGCAPDGLNINHEVGATHPDALVRSVRANHADYGVALDGDADRLQMVDATGRLYNGDELLYLMAADRMGRDEHVPGVVGTLMTNMAVEVALKQRGVRLERAKVGDRYVLEELAKHRWILGGEGSGHLLALDKHTTGDGLVSALQVLQACVRSGSSLPQLLREVVLFPQVLLNVRLLPGQDWKNNPLLSAAIREVENELGESGRVLIRASGTEPLLRVMVEARDAEQANRCAQKLADAAKAG